MTSDTVRAALLLSNRLVRIDVAPLKAREFWAVLDRTDVLGLDIGQLLADPALADTVLADTVLADTALADTALAGAISGDRLRSLLDATRAFAFEVERLEEAGIHVVSALDERFPPLLRDRMAHGCPPHIFAAGGLDSAQRPTLSIVGETGTATNATDTSALHDVARRAVAAAVVAEWAVATADSTTATDIAATVLDEAVACEAALMAFTASGINRAAREPGLRKLVQAGAVCLVSPFGPDASQSAAATRARNAMLHAVGSLTLVVACDDGTGPIWAAAFEAVQCEPASVVVVGGPNAPTGNRALAELGARELAHVDELSGVLS